MFKLRPLFLLLSLSIFLCNCNSSVTGSFENDETRVISSAFSYLKAHASEIGINNPHRDLRLYSIGGHYNHEWRIQYKQVYQNIPVSSNRITLFLSGDYEVTNCFVSNYAKDLHLPVGHEIPKVKAVKIAEQVIEQYNATVYDVLNPSLKITVYGNDSYRLIWQFDYLQTDIGLLLITIDALSGEVLEIYSYPGD